MLSSSHEGKPSLLFCAYQLSLSMHQDGHTTYASHIKDLLSKYSLDEFWTKQSAEGLSDTMINQKVKEYYIEKVWKPELKREEAKSGNGKNALRTYRLFKTSFELSAHLSLNLPWSKIASLTQLRTGSHKLPIATGRWERVTIDGQRRQKPAEQRLCDNCNEDCIGDEIHWTIECRGNRDEFLKFRSIVSNMDLPDIMMDHTQPKETFTSLMMSDNEDLLKHLVAYVHTLTVSRRRNLKLRT